MVGEPDRDSDDLLAFTVSTVWREERVSCPHPDILRAFDAGALEKGAMEFIAFHLEECQCPYCNAVLQDLRFREGEGGRELAGLRDRLLRSTAVVLRQRAR